MDSDPETNEFVTGIMRRLGADHRRVSATEIWTELQDLPKRVEDRMREVAGDYGNRTAQSYLNRMASDGVITNHGGGDFSFMEDD